MVYFSFISYRSNSFPEDIMSIGMIMIDTDTKDFRIKISDLKMRIAKKIHPQKHIFKFFESSVHQMSMGIWDLEQLDYMSRIQNGIIKITTPQIITCGLDEFDEMFYKRLEENYEKRNN